MNKKDSFLWQRYIDMKSRLYPSLRLNILQGHTGSWEDYLEEHVLMTNMIVLVDKLGK